MGTQKINKRIFSCIALSALLALMPMTSHGMKKGHAPGSTHRDNTSPSQGTPSNPSPVTSDEKEKEKEQPGEHKEEEDIDHFAKLPDEVFQLILSQAELSFADRIRSKVTRQRFKAIVEDSTTWPQDTVNLYQRMYGKEPAQIGWTKQKAADFKQLYGLDPSDLTYIPVLKIKASELESCIPCADMIWRLWIEEPADNTLDLLSSFPKLTQLGMSGRKELRRLYAIADHCPNLTQLALSTYDDGGSPNFRRGQNVVNCRNRGH